MNAVATNPPVAGESGWVAAIAPYIKNTQVFKCPSAAGAQAGAGCTTFSVGGVSHTGAGWAVPFLDYAINQNIATRGGNNLGVALAAVQYPSSIVLNLETNRARGCAGGENWNGDFIGLRGATPAARNSCLTRHNEGSNYGFVDGHVKWAKAESFKEAYVTAGNEPYWFIEP